MIPCETELKTKKEPNFGETISLYTEELQKTTTTIDFIIV